MSGQEEHDDPRGTRGQCEGTSLATTRRGRYLSLALVTAGALGSALVACYVLFFSDLLSSHCPSMEEYTRVKIHTIDKAIVDYKDRHGDYPPSLNELAVSDDEERAYFDREGLVDEWGEPFHYDPANRNPMTGKPKVFAVSPKGEILSNW